MSVATIGDVSDLLTVLGDLRSYIEQDSHPEHTSLQDIVKRVEEIKAKIIAVSTGGEISERGSFPVEKLQEVQGYILELQTQLQKIFEIQKAIATRWAAQKIDEGLSPEMVNKAVEVILGEYQKRWGHLG